MIGSPEPQGSEAATPAATPDSVVEELVLADDSIIFIRPIRASDRAALQTTVRNLSPKSIYQRFMHLPRDLSEAELIHLTEVDHRDHEALVAMSAGGELIGVARFIRLPGDRARSAEAAVTIADDWQRRGVGTALLHRLASRAVAVDVDKFVATCFADNADMLAIFHDLEGARYTRTGAVAGVVEVEVELPRDGDATHLTRALKAGASTFSRARHPSVRDLRGARR